MSSPKIILKVKFSAYAPSDRQSQDFGNYAVDYMGRKQAIESKEYLSPEEQQELSHINQQLSKVDQKLELIDSFSPKFKGRSKLDQITNKELNVKSIAEMNADEFEKYQDYMSRKNAIEAKSNSNLSNREKIELKKYNDFFKKYDLPSIEDDGVLPGYFTSEQEIVRNEDKPHIRKKIRECATAGSIMWQPIVSFDNEFLKQMKVYDPKTGYLDEAGLRKASHKMMNYLKEKEGLNPIYWTAAIHRNTDNIHIHYALVENANSRKLQKYKGIEEPRGKFKQSTLDGMKSTFANSFFKTTDLLRDLNQARQDLTKSVTEAFKESITNPSFQNNLNTLVQSLPEERNLWRWGSLNKKQKDKLNEVVDQVMLEDPEYGVWTKLFTTYQNYYESLYGHSKNNKKNVTYKKWLDMRKRVGNALLSDLRRMDKKAAYYRSKLRFNQKIDPNNFSQQAVEILKEKLPDDITTAPHHTRLHYISEKKYKERHDEWKRAQERNYKKKKEEYKEESNLKKKAIRPVIRKATANELYNKMRAVFDKEMTSKDKQEAILEYERLKQQSIEIEQNQLQQ
ncbi:relaxase MobL [Lactobacillus taiwanensis]|uniref:MobP2 family relaxase n=1 Tax=Lactobacillus taiwanensis TaxID=508451 RepID=UPI00214BA3F5|nr:MobP2 family relaxase [Lactobacillus taiwanensis]MCR1904006.1 relaxase MobL [Lactobacillus taiwanensis]